MMYRYPCLSGCLEFKYNLLAGYPIDNMDYSIYMDDVLYKYHSCLQCLLLYVYPTGGKLIWYSHFIFFNKNFNTNC